jgi:UDP-3-O-[3-hydroxymyristoyl] glucosamine N-acyltransferase
MPDSLILRVAEIADRLGGQLEGCRETEVRGAASIESAGPQHIAFLARPGASALLRATAAGCVLVPRTVADAAGRSVIRVDDPRLAFARVLEWFDTRPSPVLGVHPSAIVHPTARLGVDVSIGPHCVVGADAEVGDDSILLARVTVCDGVRIGRRCLLHAGVVVGSDGFGFVRAGSHYKKVPQLGWVEVGDDVEIGANSTIDRGTVGPTRIGSGTKLDNLVHVAHNCVIGGNVVIAAQTGIAGGARVDDWVVLGGQVGIGDKVHIETRAIVGAASAIPTGKRVPAGETMWGVPARPLRQNLRRLASLGRVDDLRTEVRELQARLQRLVGGA